MDIYGVIGYPIEHSLSPVMHNAAFRALGIDAEYKKFEVRPEELENFLLNRRDVKGFNITVPHKVKAKEVLERRFPTDQNGPFIQKDLYYVKLAGAINTVKRNRDTVEYTNTDTYGFLRALEKDLKFDTRGKKVLLIGCGGAGRAIIAGLSWEEKHIAKIFIYDKSEEAINSIKSHFVKLPQDWQDSLSKKLAFISEEDLSQIVEECKLLVNASPVGMREGDKSVIDRRLLHKDLFIYDVVYNRETELLRDARSLSLPCTGGLGMLLYQGAKSLELWTGKEAPVEVMRTALLKHSKIMTQRT